MKAEGATENDLRGGLKMAVMKTIESNTHLDEDTGTVLAQNLIYLACTTPQGMGAEALNRAMQGGRVIFDQIKRAEVGTPLSGAHFRLMLDPSLELLGAPQNIQNSMLAGKWWVDNRH
jgi:hypothetical protein